MSPAAPHYRCFQRGKAGGCLTAKGPHLPIQCLLVGVCGAAAQSGGDVWRAIGGAGALKNSVLLPLAFPRSTPILMRSSRGCSSGGAPAAAAESEPRVGVAVRIGVNLLEKSFTVMAAMPNY